MPNKFAWFLTLAVFSGLSMNLILRFGIGLQTIASGKDAGAPVRKNKWAVLIWSGINFFSGVLLWLFFSFLQSVLFLGLIEYIMVFPVSFLLLTVIEYLSKRLNFINNYGCGAPLDSAVLSSALVGGAPVGAALFIMLEIAGSFAEAATLSFGFSAGSALAVLIIGEIRRRSEMEAVPRCLRGGPLVLVTMGLLSLVFTSAAIIFYAVLGAK